MLGTRLPDSFREFLRVAHGGYIEYDVDVPLEGGRAEVMSFCQVFDLNELQEEIQRWQELSHIPKAVLPFARSGGGSAVFLDVSKDRHGVVVALVEGMPAWTGLRPESAFIKVASSFDEYVDKLHINRKNLLEVLAIEASKRTHLNATKEFLDIALPKWRDDKELVAAVDAAAKRIG